jgi:hypothetical protein
MRAHSAVAVFVALLVLVPTVTRAQTNPIELGIDAALAVSIDDPRVTTIAIPVQQFRVGFFRSPTVSIEPTLAINYINIEDFGDLSTITLGVGVLFHTSPDRARSRAYFRPFAGFTKISDGGDTSPNLGLGVGFKIPFADRRLATRLEAVVNHVFEDPDDFTTVGALIGLSFFTR